MRVAHVFIDVAFDNTLLSAFAKSLGCDLLFSCFFKILFVVMLVVGGAVYLVCEVSTILCT